MTPRSTNSWPSPLDLRLLLVVLIAALVLSPWRPTFWHAPASAVAQFALWLQPADRSPPKVALLEVDRPEIGIWGFGANALRDRHLAKALQRLTEQGKIIGILLRHPLSHFDLSSAQLQAVAKEGGDLAGTVQKYVDEQQAIRELLESDQVVLALSNGRGWDPLPLPQQLGAMSESLPILRNWLWPVVSADALPPFPSDGFQYYPALAEPGIEQSLVYQNRDAAFPGATLQLLRQAYLAADAGEGEAGAHAPLEWLRDRGIAGVGEELLPLSARGSFVPLVQEYSRMGPSYALLSLSAATARNVPSQFVLVGSADDPALRQLAANLVAVIERLTLTEPHWFAPALKSLLLVLLPVLLLLFPRFSTRGSVLAWLLLSAALIASQLGGQLIYQAWLPVGDALWSLTAGAIIMMIWRRREARRSALPDGEQDDLETYSQAQQALAGFAATTCAADADVGDAANSASHNPIRTNATGAGSLGDRAVNVPKATAALPAHNSAAAVAARPVIGGNLASTLVMELEGPQALGRYEIQREIGRGAMGTVYLAYDPKIARKVAIKTLNFTHIQEPQISSIKDRFFREAAAAGRLNHPHIVSVFDVGEEQDLAFIAMDYVDGEPLSRWVSKGRLLPPFEAYRAAANIARALHYAHSQNVIHRDVKPANIMYSEEPYQIKVTDFGIARLVDDSRTSTGEILGSPLYIAPEQLQGKKLTASADIFSLGVTFYQLLTGELPFAGDSLASLTYEIIHRSPRSVSQLRQDLPRSAARIVNRALQKDVCKRYQSALEMAEALEKAMRRDFPKQAKAMGLVQ